jgi:hypothetical protein
MVETVPKDVLEWANQELAVERANGGHNRISGVTGSGKSHLVKLQLLDASQEVERNPDAKLICYEPKREFYAWLSSLGLRSPIHYFMPSDTASVAPDFTKDYPDDIDAYTLAYAFYPETNERDRFWSDSLRTIYAGVYLAIKSILGYADLRLMCLVLEDDELTSRVLGFDPYLVQAQKLAPITGKSVGQTTHSIQLTIHSRIAQMKVLAAHLDAAKRQNGLFSLNRFVNKPGQGTLVVSKDTSYGLVQDPMNGVLFWRLMQLIDKLQADKARKIFLCIDEFPTLAGDNRCPGVKDMFLRFRSRGVIILITDQGKTTLDSIYEKDATGITGQVSNTIYLRQPDPDSARYAADDLGHERGYEMKSSFSYGGEYVSVSRSPHWYDRPIYSPTDLLNLKPASHLTGIEGIAKSAHAPGKRPWSFVVPPEVVDRIPKTDPRIVEYDEWGPGAQRLRPLTDAERHVLMNP